MTALTLHELRQFDHAAPEGRTQVRYCCPICGRGKRLDRAHRSLALDADSGLWYCHRCKNRGRLGGSGTAPYIPLAPILRRSELPWQRRLSGNRKLAGSPGEAYLSTRGISADFAQRAGVRFHPRWYYRPAVLFLLRDEHGKLVAVDGRHTDGRDDPKTHSAGRKRDGIFAPAGWLAAPEIAITEGAIDALSIGTGGLVAIATCGSAALPGWLPAALSGKRVLLASDADEAGDCAALTWASQLRNWAEVLRLRPDPYHDWNDALTRSE